MTSIEDIQKKLSDKNGIEVKEAKILHIVHKELGLQFKRIASVSW